MRADQTRDRDSIRRDCISAEIDDVAAGITVDKAHVWLSLLEPNALHGPPKFQFKLSRKAARKIWVALQAGEAKESD